MDITVLILAFNMLMSPGPGLSNEGDNDDYTKHERQEVESLRERVGFSMPQAVPSINPVENPDLTSDELGSFFTNGNTLYQDYDSRLDLFLNRHKSINENIRMVDGWRVQIFAARNREAAERTRDKANRIYVDKVDELGTAAISFVSPNYRVRFGHFIDKEKADLFRRELRSEFPVALVVPDRVEVIKRELEIHPDEEEDSEFEFRY